MPRRELLASSQRAQLLAFPADEGELIRHYSLSKADLAFVRQHRGDHNRLGVAVQICYLRFPGRVLAEDERPYPPLLGMVAVQLKLSASIWDIYAERDQTRREHLQELINWLQLSQFDRAHYPPAIAGLDARGIKPGVFKNLHLLSRLGSSRHGFVTLADFRLTLV
jgi:hypothetical protein